MMYSFQVKFFVNISPYIFIQNNKHRKLAWSTDVSEVCYLDPQKEAKMIIW